MNRCRALMDETEKLVPNAYLYECARDPGKSGRFEVTVFKSALEMEKSENGILLHSKSQTGKCPLHDEELTKALKDNANF